MSRREDTFGKYIKLPVVAKVNMYLALIRVLHARTAAKRLIFQFNLYSEQRIPNEQDYFYKDIQVARTRTNSVIYGGSKYWSISSSGYFCSTAAG